LPKENEFDRWSAIRRPRCHLTIRRADERKKAGLGKGHVKQRWWLGRINLSEFRFRNCLKFDRLKRCRVNYK
jgi:hypothetical protein